MFFKKVIHIILILTLLIQLLPTNTSGRFILQGSCKEDNSELPDATANQLRQLIEEDHKEICLDHHRISVNFVNIINAVYHFSEMLPIPHFGAIHTPPPNCVA